MPALFPEDDLAAACIWAEARGEPYEGKVAVGEVILTRTAKTFQSKGTVTSTLLWPYAFSWLNTTDPQRTHVFGVDTDDAQFQDCVQAWETAKAGSALAGGADSYVNLDVATPKWAASSILTTKIGRHSFYIVARR